MKKLLNTSHLSSIIFFVTFIFLGITPATWATAQFLATVDTTQVPLGETITLSLEFSGDSSPQEGPDISVLEESFDIGRQQQSQQFSLNGQVQESKTIWQYLLVPKKTGDLTIPAITLQTNAGPLTTQPISIHVITHAPHQRQDNTHLESSISNPQPYLHQPVLYTLRLYHRGDLRELQPFPPQDGVITEQLGQLNNRRQVVQGQELFVSEINYLLTPLRSGPLDLGTAKMKALKIIPRSNTFGNGFFSFNDSRPVTLTVDKPLSIDVKPPAYQPWLPLRNLTLEQKWDHDLTQSVLVGTPLILTLTLMAEEMGGQPLLPLDTFLQLPHQEFRMRNPKPEIERKLLSDGKTPGTQAVQTFSITPVKTGTLHIPALRIPWWNTKKNALAWAELPAQTLSVVPNPATYTSKQEEPVAMNNPVASSPIIQYRSFDPVQYFLLTLSLLALLIALWYSYSRRLNIMLPSQETKLLSLSAFKKRLQQTHEFPALKRLIQDYASSHWHLPQYASLHDIAAYLHQHYEEGEQFHSLFKELDAAMYGNHELFLEGWKKKLEIKLSYLKEKKPVRPGVQKTTLAPLNPSASL